MGNIIKYGSYSLEQAEKEQAELESGDAAFMSFKVGRNVIRILPPPVGKNSPFRIVYQHFFNIPGKQEPIVFVCPRYELKKPCPVCAEADRLKSTGNPVDEERADGLYARRRIYCNAINRAEPEKGPRIAAFGKTVHEPLLALRKNEEEGGDYTNPENGFDVVVNRTGTGKNDTKYVVTPSRTNTPLASTPEQMQDWIDTQHNLERYAKCPTEQELNKLLFGEAGPPQAAQQTTAPAQSGGTRVRRTAMDAAIDAEGQEVK